jgi:hypothetical protein
MDTDFNTWSSAPYEYIVKLINNFRVIQYRVWDELCDSHTIIHIKMLRGKFCNLYTTHLSEQFLIVEALGFHSNRTLVVRWSWMLELCGINWLIMNFRRVLKSFSAPVKIVLPFGISVREYGYSNLKTLECIFVIFVSYTDQESG